MIIRLYWHLLCLQVPLLFLSSAPISTAAFANQNRPRTVAVTATATAPFVKLKALGDDYLNNLASPSYSSTPPPSSSSSSSSSPPPFNSANTESSPFNTATPYTFTPPTIPSTRAGTATIKDPQVHNPQHVRVAAAPEWRAHVSSSAAASASATASSFVVPPLIDTPTYDVYQDHKQALKDPFVREDPGRKAVGHLLDPSLQAYTANAAPKTGRRKAFQPPAGKPLVTTSSASTDTSTSSISDDISASSRSATSASASQGSVATTPGQISIKASFSSPSSAPNAAQAAVAGAKAAAAVATRASRLGDDHYYEFFKAQETIVDDSLSSHEAVATTRAAAAAAAATKTSTATRASKKSAKPRQTVVGTIVDDSLSSPEAAAAAASVFKAHVATAESRDTARTSRKSRASNARQTVVGTIVDDSLSSAEAAVAAAAAAFASAAPPKRRGNNNNNYHGFKSDQGPKPSFSFGSTASAFAYASSSSLHGSQRNDDAVEFPNPDKEKAYKAAKKWYEEYNQFSNSGIGSEHGTSYGSATIHAVPSAHFSTHGKQNNNNNQQKSPTKQNWSYQGPGNAPPTTRFTTPATTTTTTNFQSPPPPASASSPADRNQHQADIKNDTRGPTRQNWDYQGHASTSSQASTPFSNSAATKNFNAPSSRRTDNGSQNNNYNNNSAATKNFDAPSSRRTDNGSQNNNYNNNSPKKQQNWNYDGHPPTSSSSSSSSSSTFAPFSAKSSAAATPKNPPSYRSQHQSTSTFAPFSAKSSATASPTTTRPASPRAQHQPHPNQYPPADSPDQQMASREEEFFTPPHPSYPTPPQSMDQPKGTGFSTTPPPPVSSGSTTESYKKNDGSSSRTFHTGYFISGVPHQLVAEGLDVLYPPHQLSQRTAKSRNDGYWPYISGTNKVANPPPELTYGEMDVLLFAQLLDDASMYMTTPTYDQKLLCDIGSGTGRLVVAASALHPSLHVSVGIEILPGIHELAVQTGMTLEKQHRGVLPPHDLPLSPIELICGSITSEADMKLNSELLNRVDLFFLFGSSMPDQVVTEIGHTLGNHAQVGALLISMDKELPTGRMRHPGTGIYYQFEALTKKEGYFGAAAGGGTSTAYTYRLIESAASPYARLAP